MPKFYEVPYEGEESSFYLVVGAKVLLFFQGELSRTLVTIEDCNDLVSLNLAIAFE